MIPGSEKKLVIIVNSSTTYYDFFTMGHSHEKRQGLPDPGLQHLSALVLGGNVDDAGHGFFGHIHAGMVEA